MLTSHKQNFRYNQTPILSLVSSENHSSGRIVTSSPKCELLIPASDLSDKCEFCAGERQKKDRERFAKLEEVEPIFTVEDELKLVNSSDAGDPEVKLELIDDEAIKVQLISGMRPSIRDHPQCQKEYCTFLLPL